MTWDQVKALTTLFVICVAFGLAVGSCAGVGIFTARLIGGM